MDWVRVVVRNLKPDDAALMGAPADTISAAAATAAALVFSLSPAACAPPTPAPPPPLFFLRGMTWRSDVPEERGTGSVDNAKFVGAIRAIRHTAQAGRLAVRTLVGCRARHKHEHVRVALERYPYL